MFLTKNFICFYSKIITHETILIIKFSHINSITKSMQFLIFPTQIRIETRNSIYSFTSFRSRSNTLDHLSNLLLQSRQREANNIDLLNHKEKIEQLNKTIELSSKIEMNNIENLLTNNKNINNDQNNEKFDSNQQCSNLVEMNEEKKENGLNNSIRSFDLKYKNSIIETKSFTDYSHIKCLVNENNKISNNYI